MEIDGGGDQPALATSPVRGKKRPPSPATPPSNGEDSSKSTTSDEEDEDRWEVSDSGSEEEGNRDQETCQPFTIDDFPRVSSNHSEQAKTVYGTPDVPLRGPLPIILFPAFKGPVGEENDHCFDELYELHDESEINANNVWTRDCSLGCRCHPTNLLQFIDLKIAGYAKPGRANIFGFFAARDLVEPLRNYVYRREIDNYEAVTVKQKTGMARLSLTGPARGICITGHVLFEFELHVRTEDPPEDGPKDELLIEGCTEFSNMFKSESFIETRRLYGKNCGLDMKFLVLINALQAKVDIAILSAPTGGFKLNLYAKTSGFRDVIRLFRGVAKGGFRMSSVVAVRMRSHLDLCIEDSQEDRRMWQDSFPSCYHGTVDREVDLDDSTKISVKVTWRAIEQHTSDG